MVRSEEREIFLFRWCLAAVLVLRIGLPRLFGLLDNDSIVVLTDAQRQMETGAWSMVSTLQVWLVSRFFQLFGQSLAAARWVSVLAGLGTMLVLFLRGREEGDQPAGLFTALFFGVAPIAIFFGSSALPYVTLTFFGVLGVWLLARAVERGQWGFGLLAGLAWGAAFLCKTFAAVFVLPAIVLFVQHALNASSRRKKLWLGPLLAGIGWAAVLGGVIAWRWPVFHWSVFNDYVTDWRFDLASAVWHARWVDLVNLHTLMLPLLAPGLYLAVRRGLIRPFDRIAFWLIVADAGVYLANPVNHFPRVLLPSVPLLAWFAGRELAFAWRQEKTSDVIPAWTVVALLTLVLSFVRPDWLLDPRPWTVLASAFVALVVFLLVRPLFSVTSTLWRDRLISLFFICVTLFGLAQGYQALDRVDRVYAARIEALRDLRMSDGVLGGGDALNYVANGRNNFANLLDLPRERLIEILDGRLPDVLSKMGIGGIVVDLHDSEGVVPMLAGLAKELGRDPTKVRNPFADLDRSPYAVRLLDNTLFAAYRLETVLPPETQSYPKWERVLPVWDRSGLITTQPTPARLVVREQPSLESMERQVLVELTDLPGGEDEYDVQVQVEDETGKPLWRSRTMRVGHGDDAGAPGVRLYQFYIARSPEPNPEAVVVPSTVRGGRVLRVTAKPAGGAEPLWVMVTLPAWW